MAKKYLSIEETAAELGTDVAEVNRLREAQEIRGFSDRGTWKFKPEDVEELSRRRQADSSPSVPILDDDESSKSVVGEGSSVILADAGGSSVVLSDDEDDVGEQATVVHKKDDLLSKAASDSDVRLVLDDSLTTDSDPDVNIPPSDSDSDVRLADDAAKPGDSDSDVQLVDDQSDSDVKMVDDEASGTVAMTSDSDSDVSLVGETENEIALEAAPGSDSDVQLIGSDVATDMEIGLAPVEDESSKPKSALDDDEDDSGIALASDSAFGADSGIALESAIDSGISLEVDSGIEDSGIALAADDEDSGITLDSPGDSGIALEALNEGQSGSGVLDETQFEIEGFDDDEFELKSGPGSSSSDTGVIVFDDDSGVDMHGATAVRKQRESDISGSEEFEFDDDLEVADDVIGEDDELDDMDVFDATDEDFADSFEAGESHAEFIHPGVGAPVQQDWGVGTFIGLILTTAIMAVCGLVMFDFVRSMWGWSEPSAFTGKVMNMLGGLFKK